MTDLGQKKSLSLFEKKRIRESLDRSISNTPKNKEMKEKIYRSLIGDYTEEDILEAQLEQQLLLEQLEKEFEIKECVSVSESKVFLGTAKEILNNYIEDDNKN